MFKLFEIHVQKGCHYPSDLSTNRYDVTVVGQFIGSYSSTVDNDVVLLQQLESRKGLR